MPDTDERKDMSSAEKDARAIPMLFTNVESRFQALESKLQKIPLLHHQKTETPLLFYVGFLEAVKASLLLLKEDLLEPAAATTRLAFEHLFAAVACAKNPSYFDTLKESDRQEMEEWVAVLGWKGMFSFGPDDEASSKNRKVTFKARAKDAGLEDLYNQNYKLLSKTGAHASILFASLTRQSDETQLPKLNLKIAVIVHLRCCIEHFEKLWEQYPITVPSPDKNPQ